MPLYILLQKVKEYKEAFNRSKEKIAKANEDIKGFEADYQNLVDKFQNDELQNILVSANKEITLKIDERKKKIKDEQTEMNKLVQRASVSKKKLVKLTAEKKAIQLKLDCILDAYEFYNKTLSDIIEYSTSHTDNLCSFFGKEKEEPKKEEVKEEVKEEIKIEQPEEVDIKVKEENKKNDKKNKKEPKKIEIIEKEEPKKIEDVSFDDDTHGEEYFNFDDSIPD